MVAVDRRAFIAGLGGAAAVAAMDSEAKADALEEYLDDQLETAVAAKEPGTAKKFPTVAELEAQIETRTFRRGVGSLFAGGSKVKRLTAMPEKPTLLDYFNLRWAPANHVPQSAALAEKNGMSEEIILACLLHDVVQSLIKTDHVEPFIDIIGRHFKQPKEGLGNDNSPVAHMWRSMARPDSLL